jgi:hypothetical protein
MIRCDRAIVLMTCAAVLLAGSTFAQGVAPAPTSVMTRVAAPIFASAHDRQRPLVMATQGARLTVLDERAEWYHVTFKGLEDGRVEGYIRITHVAAVPVTARRPTQGRGSVPDATVETQRTYGTLRADIRRRFAQSSRATAPIEDARYRRGTAILDQPPSALPQEMTLDEFHGGGVRRFRY